jgi:hypothetical protein
MLNPSLLSMEVTSKCNASPESRVDLDLMYLLRSQQVILFSQTPLHTVFFVGFFPLPDDCKQSFGNSKGLEIVPLFGFHGPRLHRHGDREHISACVMEDTKR